MVLGKKVTVIGTAGHVDHGKSALIRALTGTDPDRLEEEKLRGLTIELGFAWMALPSGDLASFVDVPGHEDFIRNMLAGAGAVDACMLVIAADEGPMPQTLEHIVILDLLGIENGVVVLSKTDLVDSEWLDLVREEVADLLRDTSLANLPILSVSATTGEGLDGVVEALQSVVASSPEPIDKGRPRLSVDRAFTMSGFGTVVTGTLRDGPLKSGEPVEILPGEQQARIRNLQSHGQPVDQAFPGRRTAINLSGIDATGVERGDTLANPGDYRPTNLVDVMLRLVDGADVPISHDDEVHVFHGAADTPAFARIIGANEIAPGERAAVQLRLARPTTIAPGDRFIVRRPSPPATIGGGIVLDPHPTSRRKRYRIETIERFRDLDGGNTENIAWHMLSEREPASAGDLRPEEVGLEPDVRDAALAALEAEGRVRRIGTLWITDRGWDVLQQRTQTLLSEYHSSHPLRQGPPPEELRQQLGLRSEAYGPFLDGAIGEGWIARTGDSIHIPGHQVQFSGKQQSAVDDLLGAYADSPYSPPSEKEAEAAVGPAVIAALVSRGDLVAVGGDVLFGREAYGALRQAVARQLDDTGQVTVADVRDQFGTSRKYALALLEHLDRIRVTKREGDLHVRGAASAAGQGSTDVTD